MPMAASLMRNETSAAARSGGTGFLRPSTVRSKFEPAAFRPAESVASCIFEATKPGATALTRHVGSSTEIVSTVRTSAALAAPYAV